MGDKNVMIKSFLELYELARQTKKQYCLDYDTIEKIDELMLKYFGVNNNAFLDSSYLLFNKFLKEHDTLKVTIENGDFLFDKKTINLFLESNLQQVADDFVEVELEMM